ncbi:uncharacterized protein LOC121405174 [Drosophila obscura]|uniref:uncharacterized protein LOC121405174 n=1 Tax=Drosophila obscura TaxID=7282 RepID=UPI001BB1E420|nr:uncharacterized protein LOC121405174 [Drosophila obscura]
MLPFPGPLSYLDGHLDPVCRRRHPVPYPAHPHEMLYAPADPACAFDCPDHCLRPLFDGHVSPADNLPRRLLNRLLSLQLRPGDLSPGIWARCLPHQDRPSLGLRR